MAANCPERLTKEFMQYIWNFSQVQRPKIIAKLAKYQQQENKQVITLQNPHQVLNFLEHLH